jgi:CHAT domain-containing protein
MRAINAIGVRLLSAALLLALLALMPAQGLAAPDDDLAKAMTAYNAGTTTDALTLIDKSVESITANGGDPYNYLFWSLYIRLADKRVDETIWKHIGQLQAIKDDKLQWLRWTIVQAALAQSSMLQGNWNEGYKQAYDCIVGNQHPVGDFVPFFTSCLHTLLDAAPLVGQIQEAATTAQAYAAKLVYTNDLYQSNVCELLFVLNRAFQLQAQPRHAYFALMTYEKYADICVGKNSTKAARFIRSALELLIELGNVEVIRGFTSKLDVDRILQDPELAQSEKASLKWPLLNTYSFLGQTDKAEAAFSREDALDVEKRAPDNYPYTLLRDALVTYSTLAAGNTAKFEQLYGDLAERSSRNAGFVPAVQMMRVEADLQKRNYSSGAQNFQKFIDTFIEQAQREQELGKRTDIRLRGYNRLIADQAFAQFVQLPVELRTDRMASAIFQIAQAYLAPLSRFGIEKVELDSLVGGDASNREMRSIVRSNEKSRDVEDWRLLQSIDSFLESRKLTVRDKIAPEDIRKGNMSAEAIRALASFTNDVEFRITNRKLDNFRAAPMSIPQVQQTLVPDEALFMFFSRGDSLISYCITSRNVSTSVRKVDVGKVDEALTALNSALRPRVGVDPAADNQFPIDSAHFAYKALFEDQERCMRGAKHLFMVPPPDLALLPFNAFIADRRSGILEDVVWLPDVVPISLLTSVPALRFLRQTERKSDRLSMNFLGVSNPDFSGSTSTQPQQIVVAQSLYPTRGATALSGLNELSQLPEADREVDQIAALFPQESVRIISGGNATEPNLRKVDLGAFRFIDFATHALVAGEFGGVSEPSLVLVPGDSRTSRADGLLSASEINQVKLNAELVLLSACNTAAGDGAFAAPGLSGIADSVLAAGAKAVAATQWSVDSEAALRVAVATVEEMVRSNKGAAAALSEAFKKVRQSSGGTYLHPRYWAAFIIVGDGGATPPIQKKATGTSAGNDMFARRFEYKPEKPRVAEWLDMARIESSQPGTIVVGFSAEPPDGTENRAAGILQRFDEGGRSVWRLSDNEHSFARVGILPGDQFAALSSTHSDQGTKIFLNIGSLVDGQITRQIELAGGQGITSGISLIVEGGRVIAGYHSTVYRQGDDDVEFGVVEYDLKAAAIHHRASFKLDRDRFKKPLDLPNVEHASLFRVNGVNYVAAALSFMDRSSTRSKALYGYRSFCFNSKKTLIVKMSGEIREISLIDDVSVMKAHQDSNRLAYVVVKPCERPKGLWIEEMASFVDRKNVASKRPSLDWATEIWIGNITTYRNVLVIAGDLKIPRPFSTRPYRAMDDIRDDFLTEDRSDEYDPRTAFIAELGTDGALRRSFIFDDQRSRHASDVVVDPRSGVFYVSGSASGGDSWLFSGKMQ